MAFSLLPSSKEESPNGGAAVTDNKYTSITTGALGGIDSTSESRWGAAVGAGFDYAFVPN
jgi:outer membrane immunogenic protein